MRVLIITPFFKPNIGGAETFAEDLAIALAKKHTVHICTIKWTKPFLFKGTSGTKALSLLWRLFLSYRKLRKYRYERVYALGLTACLLCYIYRIKFNAIILTAISYGKYNFLLRFILNKADRIFIEGEVGKNQLIANKITSPIVPFEHWADKLRFYPVKHINEKLKVLFLGRPIKEKGMHIIKDCEKLTKGIDYEYVKDVPYTDLPKYYQMADVVVIPSIYYESYSRIVVEAALCGCVVITSNMGSLPEQVKNFGIIAPPIAEEFKRILEELNDNRRELDIIKAKTLRYANNNFTESNADCFLR